VGIGENPRESLSELARLGARLIIQRAVEDEFDVWLGRTRYERRPAHQRGLRNSDWGLRNGFRPRKVQTLEGELQVEIPQVREAAEPFVSKLFPWSTKVLRTEPLRATSRASTGSSGPSTPIEVAALELLEALAQLLAQQRGGRLRQLPEPRLLTQRLDVAHRQPRARTR
jgi:Transposase, Mutator family